MSAEEIVERAIRFANRPTHANWLKLVGEAGIFTTRAAEPENIGEYLNREKRIGRNQGAPAPDYLNLSAERFRAALSDIAHGRQTFSQLRLWDETAKRVTPTPTRTIVGNGYRETIEWSAPRDVVQIPELEGFRFVTVDSDALLATVLTWLLNPDMKFRGLRECGRGQQCDKERFFFPTRAMRTHCSREHMYQLNKSTATDRSKERRARDKLRQLFPANERSRSPDDLRAAALIRAVKAPGLSVEELVKLAIEERSRRSTQPQSQTRIIR